MKAFSGSRFIYTILLWLLLPYLFFHLLWRARKQPEYLHHIAERFGFYTVRCEKPVIWLHTVSVGETRAALSLINRLKEKYPAYQLLLTHTTPTGRATSEQLYGDTVRRVYLPYDYPFAVRRFLQHFNPCVGVLLETEIWFNLIHACRVNQIPLQLLNARLSEKSAAGYARYPNLVRAGLKELSAIAAQTPADAERLSQLGGKDISVMGNLKFDIEPPALMLQLGQQLRNKFGVNRKIFLAASTREGEEVLLLDALQSIAVPNLLMVIVPRHPQRFAGVESLIAQRGIRFQCRSGNLLIAPETQVVLGDSMGEMFAYYAACDIALIGGSLLPFGGQNLIEACAVGKPVIIGAHTFNFEQASQLAVAGGAAVRINDPAELAQTLQKLLSEPERMSAMGQAGKVFVNANRGATERASQCIDRGLSLHI
jgi:3-deoxy-D-manno-octulosonic-acid transferase